MITEQDNVATALRDIGGKERVRIGIGAESKEMTVLDTIPFGHKFAVQDIKKGQHILKYGEVIGKAMEDIPAGTHAHVHNIEGLRGRGDLDP